MPHYREFPPPPPLAGHFVCLWQSVAGGPDDGPHLVLPDCCIDIVFVGDEPPVLAGPWTEPFVAEVPPGAYLVGARWHPGRAPDLLGLPAREFLNQTLPLRDICGSAWDDRLAAVREEAALEARRAALGAALIRLLKNATGGDREVRAGLAWLARHPHGGMDQLSQWIGLSSRQMQRRFSAAVGYGPKMFQSVLRFQRLLDFGGRGPGVNLAEAASAAGYADQAHMTREVRRFAGSSPGALLPTARTTLALSDLFKTADQGG